MKSGNRVISIETDRVDDMRKTLTYTDEDGNEKTCLHVVSEGLGFTRVEVPLFYEPDPCYNPMDVNYNYDPPTPAWQSCRLKPHTTLREPQKLAIYDALKFFEQQSGQNYVAGRIEADTGVGKTLIGLSVAEQMSERLLVIVPKIDLIKTWMDDTWKFFPGAVIGVVHQSNVDVPPHADVVIASAFTLASRYKNGMLLGLLQGRFGMTIIDEGHMLPTETLFRALRFCDARKRLALSATWRRGDNTEDLFELHCGPVIHTSKFKTLAGTVYPLKFDCGFNLEQYKGYDGKLNRSKLLTAYSNHPYPILTCCESARRAVDSGRHVLIVSDRVKQCKEIYKILTMDDEDKCLYVGTSTKSERSKLDTAKIVVATYESVKVGTNVPHWDTLIMATPRSDIYQVVGRIRREHPDKKTPLVVDLVAQDIPYFRNMYRGRLNHYSECHFEVLINDN